MPLVFFNLLILILRINMENIILSSSDINKIIEDSNLFYDSKSAIKDYKNQFICIDYSADMYSEKYSFLRISDKKIFVLEIIDDLEMSEKDRIKVLNEDFKLVESAANAELLTRIKEIFDKNT